MKNKALITLVAAAIASSSAFAMKSDEASVNDAMNQLSAAMIASDGQKMKALTAETMTYGHSNGRVQDQSAFIDTIVSGQTRYRRIDLTNTVIHVTGDNAVIRDHFSGDVESGGKVKDVEFDTLLVWQKQDGKWKLLARQGYTH
jgi:ketosteroid isomerase-like protein